MVDAYIAVPKWLDAAIGANRLSKTVLVRIDDHHNRVTGQCNPRLQTLAHEIGVSIRTITRALCQLRSLGLVRSRRTRRGNHYVCAPRSEWREILTRHACPMDTNVQSGLDTNVQSSRARVLLTELPQGELCFEDVPCLSSGVLDSEAGGGTAQTPVEKQEVPVRPVTPEQLAAELAERHPEPGLLGRVPGEIRDVLRAVAPAMRDQVIARIRASHQRWRYFWADHPTRFKPQLWRWLRDGDWAHPPAAAAFTGTPPPHAERKPVARAMSCEKCEQQPGWVTIIRRDLPFTEPCGCRQRGAA